MIRAGIEVRYSEGFNPRIKMSLPFPRSVGIEADDELLCVSLPARRAEGSGQHDRDVSLGPEQYKKILSDYPKSDQASAAKKRLKALGK